MESLNMAKLNLSSVQSHTSNGIATKTEEIDTKVEINNLTDSDDDNMSEYRDDIWNHLVELEAEKMTLHLQSPQLEFRGALVQQLRDVTKKLGLTMATLHSAVTHLDLFMDAHRLRADRLKHVALACLSLAAKSEEKFSRAPTLKTLAKVSGVQLCGKTFRQLEWMVGQHIRWKLLAPTPVSFASMLAQYIVADSDLTTRHPKFVRKFKRDGVKQLEAYLDLTLSDVRLKVVDSVVVGCACVACARAELGLAAWPAWLATRAGRAASDVTPIARLLQRMMHILKSRESSNETDVESGYGSARASPNLTPCTTPELTVSPALSASSSTSTHLTVDSSYRNNPIEMGNGNHQPGNGSTHLGNVSQMTSTRLTVGNSYRNNPIEMGNGNHQPGNDSTHLGNVSQMTSTHLTVGNSYRNNPIEMGNGNHQPGNDSTHLGNVTQKPETFYAVLDVSNSNTLPTTQEYRLPSIDMTCQRVNDPLDYRFSRTRRLIEASLGSEATSQAVKRALDANVELDSKRYRLTAQMSQVVI